MHRPLWTSSLARRTFFLDVLVTQVLALRERHGARLPLVLMNSMTTRAPSPDRLRRYDGLRVPGVPLDFLQSREPKIRADDLQPVQWPADPELEWCPPGHGDIYTALAASGTRCAARWPTARATTSPVTRAGGAAGDGAGAGRRHLVH